MKEDQKAQIIIWKGWRNRLEAKYPKSQKPAVFFCNGEDTIPTADPRTMTLKLLCQQNGCLGPICSIGVFQPALGEAEIKVQDLTLESEAWEITKRLILEFTLG